VSNAVGVPPTVSKAVGVPPTVSATTGPPKSERKADRMTIEIMVAALLDFGVL
jgi:hypothetical protein